jgi:hypothetical protein
MEFTVNDIECELPEEKVEPLNTLIHDHLCNSVCNGHILEKERVDGGDLDCNDCPVYWIIHAIEEPEEDEEDE